VKQALRILCLQTGRESPERCPDAEGTGALWNHQYKTGCLS